MLHKFASFFCAWISRHYLSVTHDDRQEEFGAIPQQPSGPEPVFIALFRKLENVVSAELMTKQAELNASLDLDKNERQVVAETPETEEAKAVPSTFLSRVTAGSSSAMTV
jgi:hypothetical protein